MSTPSETKESLQKSGKIFYVERTDKALKIIRMQGFSYCEEGTWYLVRTDVENIEIAIKLFRRNGVEAGAEPQLVKA